MRSKRLTPELVGSPEGDRLEFFQRSCYPRARALAERWCGLTYEQARAEFDAL